MADRTISKAYGPAISTAIFAVLGYCHLGTITHRSTWDWQHVWSPIIYALFPQLYICEVLLNTILWVQRHIARRRLMHRTDDIAFILCSILGLHTRSRCWHEPPMFIANLGSEKRAGMLRIHSICTERLERHNKYTNDEFSKSSFFWNCVRLCMQLYQSIYASKMYIKRVDSMPSATLYIDHIAGAYAISGAAVTLSALLLHLQPYEWHDRNDTPPDEDEERYSDIDTSNAWVYEGLAAMTTHLCIWTSFWLWNLVRTIKGPDESWMTIYHNWENLLKESASPLSIVFTAAMFVASTSMALNARDVFTPHRYGMTWVNRWFRLGYYIGGVIARTVLGTLAVSIGGATWWYAVKELNDVEQGKVLPWNANWTEPNPIINPVLDVVWCLYC